jgi:cytochrome c oxidase assembly protein subunit 15
MVCVPMLCRADADSGRSRSRLAGSLQRLSLLLPAIVFLQLIWAAWLRHSPTPLAQRLHFITAFVVVGIAVWLSVRIYTQPLNRKQFGFFATHLLIAIACQIILGVEAWMGKFAAQGASGMIPPELRQVTTHSATIRTLHQLIGAAILASSVALALRIGRSGGPSLEHTDTPAESP